jgi:hypothetical protein
MNHNHYGNGGYPHMGVSTAGYGLDKERDKSKPVFDARLEKGGVNKIEVEVLAGKNNAAYVPVNGEAGPQEPKKKDVQWEKITCFVHVLRR